ncbi:transglutaminaseTgpA domain-containing protein [Chloroflexota bacterium]
MVIHKYAVVSRVLVFLAVSCSIAAVAFTIREPILLAIGIPGLAAGHFYSWHRREASILRSLILLLFMIITAFLGEEILFSGFSDRLLLSRYLIYGLVLGSFDLMRRRNVVASLILGGLLLVLISEFALSLWFLVFVVVFTVLALTAVTVDRLEAEASQATLVGDFRWLDTGKVWFSLTAGILLLSAVFFLLMPRLASSEVAQASWLPSRLDLSLGGPAMLPGRPSASIAPGILPSRQEDGVFGDGQYVTLGYVGSLADEAVMHVRSRVSSYWRGATLDQYDGQGWRATSLQIKLRNENRREYVLPDSNLRLSGEKVYWQAYYILADQPNAVFTGYNPGRIYLPQTGPILLERGALYRALSLVPNLRPELLRNDNAISEDISNLTLPPISERTAALAESIVQGASTDYDKAARLERFLLTNYPYELNIEPVPSGRDAVDFFLFEQQAGYCSSFATSMAVMARHAGLPARIAVGYLPGFIDPITGAHIVRVGDAHAWVEIHFQRYGWVVFDPTPRPDAAIGFATGRNSVYFALEDLTGITFAGILSPLAGNFSLGPHSIPVWVWGVLLGGGITITILALLLTRHKTRTRQEIKGYSVLDGEERSVILNLYRKMIALLIKKGLPSRQLYQTPCEYATIVCSQIPDSRELVEWLSQAASSAAYDPNPLNQSTVPEARRKLAALRQTLTRRHRGL